MKNLPRHALVTKGFTIIELLVVIAIIGIISAAIMAGMSSARAKGRLGGAMQVMKSLHDIAMVCVNTNSQAYTFCLPGQATAGCTASPIGDTNTGGGGALCSSNPNGVYVTLPSGWIYCDSSAGVNGVTNCGTDTSSLPQTSQTYFRLKAQNYLDGWVITCDESGCNSAADVS